MSDINFYVSSAGIAGDSYKLLVGIKDGIKMSEGFTNFGIFKTWNLKRAKKRLIKKFNLLETSRIENVDVTLFNEIEFKLIKEVNEGDLIVIKFLRPMRQYEIERVNQVMNNLKLKSKFIMVPPDLDIEKVIRNEIKETNRNEANE